MDYILRPIYQERASQPETLGVILISKREDQINLTDTFDEILLIIVKEGEQPIFTKHYCYEEKKVAMHIITEHLLNKWIYIGRNRRIVDWIFHGKVMFERNEYVSNLIFELEDFSFYGRKIKSGVQFAKLVRSFTEGKEFFNRGDYLDAYNHVVKSLQYLARLAVIDSGLYPEVTVWSQVKKIEPSIYKLYEELVTSTECVEKRLELLFLAIDFSINSRTLSCSQHIIETLKTKDVWSIQELHNHPELKFYSVDLELFIEYLVEKGYIIAESVESKNETIYHRYYRINNEA
ncbi:MAG: hypothetical protein GX072_14745 [Lysinibacillus sp.]|nr:hypothetical protein [Lysinibacillus sp.]